MYNPVFITPGLTRGPACFFSERKESLLPKDFSKFAFKMALSEVGGIVDTNIFDQRNFGNPLHRAALTRTLIVLRDCLGRSENAGKRYTRPSVGRFEGKQVETHDLIVKARTVVSHAFSETRKFEGGYLDYAQIVGSGRAAIVFAGEREIRGRDDDIMYAWGKIEIFLWHDIVSTFNWLRDNYAKDLPKIKRPVQA